MKRVSLILIAALLLAGSPLGIQAGAATSGCDVRILELGTAGRYGTSMAEQEAQDLLIVRNISATTSFTVQMVYIQSNGIRSEIGTMSLGTIAPNATKAFVSPSLAAMNPDATVLANLGLSSAGGTVLVQKTSGAVYCDQLGWGHSAQYETAVALAPAPGATLVRDTHGSAQDTNNNAADFVVSEPVCGGVQFSELQPFVTDANGGPTEAWVELWGREGIRGNCTLLTTSMDRSLIPQSDMPAQDERAVIDRGIDATGQAVPLHLGEAGATLWLADHTTYAAGQPVYLPVDAAGYPALERGQSWGLIDGLWRPTYKQTPGATNVYTTTIERGEDQVPPACADVRITELLPNPKGDDAENEWVELYNPTQHNVLLAGCALSIDGDDYYFSEFDGLAPNEYRAFSAFSTETGSAKSVAIRNSSDVQLLVSWEDASNRHIWQSFYLYDGKDTITADEGISWARFDDGWRWTTTSSPTPGAVNTLDPPASSEPTEATATSANGAPADGNNTPGLPIAITELLPNPAAPLSDDTDEYVELHNDNKVAVDLLGYTLQTGTKFSYTYTFPSKIIEPGAYMVVMSKESSLLLSNTSGQARLLDPTGIVVSQTDVYTDAAEGVAWALVDGVWKWTSDPTQAATNVFTAVSTSTTAKKAVAAKTAKATTKTTKTSVGTKAAKTTTPSASAAKGVANTSNKPAPVHTAVLAVVGLIGVLYAAYEYRTDIANYLYKLRSHRAARGQARAATTGR